MIVDEAFILACSNGFLEVAEWLATNQLASYVNKIDNSLVQLAFNGAIKNNHTDIILWLLSLNRFIDVHMYDELAFRLACETGNLDLARHYYYNYSPIDVTIKDHIAFTSACKRKHNDVAEWLTSVNIEYYVEIVNGQIMNYRINNEFYVALELLKLGYCDKVLDMLKIGESSAELSNMCIICRDLCDIIIQTKCKHNYCLSCLLSWFLVINAKKDFRCAYCRGVFNWSDCVYSC
jgi:hypothetical protein